MNVSTGNNEGINVNGNDVNLNMGGLDVNVDENGVTVNGSVEESNTVLKYVLLGVAFLVAFVVLLFGIIAIKKSKGQIKVK